jgi:hypothetical protein
MNPKFHFLWQFCLFMFMITLVAVPASSANASGIEHRSGIEHWSVENNNGFSVDIQHIRTVAAGGPIYKYLIHLGTGGPVACGDSLVGIVVGRRTGDPEKDVATALRSLFSTPKYQGGLYNPLSSSKFRIQGVRYNARNKEIAIDLSGKLVRPNTYCEIARARTMVWATAQQFPEISHAIIMMTNNILLGDLLPVKDKSKKK